MTEVRRTTSSDGYQLLESINHLTNKSLKVGWINGSHYIASKESVAKVAEQNEFGNPNKHIPARPFMRPTITRESVKWQKLVDDGGKKILKGALTVDNVLNLLGQKVTGDIKESIKAVYYPALAERTVLARIERSSKLSRIKGQIKEKTLGNVTKPLIDTGIMFNTITHEITSE